MNAEAVVDALCCKLEEMDAETLSDTLVKVKVLPVIDIPADWPTEVVFEKKVKTGRSKG